MCAKRIFKPTLPLSETLSNEGNVVCLLYTLCTSILSKCKIWHYKVWKRGEFRTKIRVKSHLHSANEIKIMPAQCVKLRTIIKKSNSAQTDPCKTSRKRLKVFFQQILTSYTKITFYTDSSIRLNSILLFFDAWVFFNKSVWKIRVFILCGKNLSLAGCFVKVNQAI